MTIPSARQYRIKGVLPQAIQEQLVFRWYSGGRSWAGSRAFAVPNNDAVGTIRISVAGRDKHGLIEPGEEYNRVRDDIANALRKLTDPVTGRPVVKRVTYVHEVFRGPFARQLPNLTVLWVLTKALVRRARCNAVGVWQHAPPPGAARGRRRHVRGLCLSIRPLLHAAIAAALEREERSS
jgi:hypothetical protein